MASATLPALGAMTAAFNDRKIPFELALGIALVVEVALVAGLAYWASRPQPLPAKPKVIAVHMVAPPPKPAPPPPPKPVVQPRPKPTPKPPPPIHHPVIHHHVTPKPVPKPPPAPPPIAVPPPPTPTPAPVVPAPVVPPPAPPAPKPPPPAPAPPAPPPEVDTGIAPYGAGARTLIQNHLQIGPLIKRLGLQGTVTVSFRVKPGGGAPYDIQIVSGSGNPLIRKAAMSAIKATSFPPYRKDMPQRALKFTVPIQISTDN